jgi:nitrogen fixation NifU-like protein
VSGTGSLYNDVIMDHIRNARNFHALVDASHRAQGVNPLCGDTFEVYVRVDGERVEEASFQCECCGISMASASVMTGLVRGRTVGEVKVLVEEFESLLRDPDIPSPSPDGGRFAVLALIRDVPSRVNCALLGWKTLAAALDGRETVTVQD